jgi:hypothetical protein
MVQPRAVTYLVALAFNYHDPRLYPTYRILSASLTDTVFVRPDTFSLQAFVDGR